MTPMVLSGLQDLELVYHGLVALVEKAEGFGFHNNDQGHPFYVVGARGSVWEEEGDVEDGPDKNRIFIMLKEVCGQLKTSGAEELVWFKDLSTWESFCKLAVKSYHEKRRN